MTDPAYFTAREAAAYLRIGLTTFYEHVRPNVGTITIGRRVLFARDALDAFMVEHSAA